MIEVTSVEGSSPEASSWRVHPTNCIQEPSKLDWDRERSYSTLVWSLLSHCPYYTMLLITFKSLLTAWTKPWCPRLDLICSFAFFTFFFTLCSGFGNPRSFPKRQQQLTIIMAGRATLSMRLKNLCLTKTTLPTLGREVGNGSPNIFFRVVHLRHKQLTHYQSRDNVKVDLGRAEPVLAVTSSNNIDLPVHHLEGKSEATFIQMMF